MAASAPPRRNRSPTSRAPERRTAASRMRQCGSVVCGARWECAVSPRGRATKEREAEGRRKGLLEREFSRRRRP